MSALGSAGPTRTRENAPDRSTARYRPGKGVVGPTPADMPALLARQLRVDPETGCWPFTRRTLPSGYGRISWHGRERQVHQVTWEIYYGREWPQGPKKGPDRVVADHLCHDPTTCKAGNACPHRRCANPTHVVPTTNKVNCRRGRAHRWQSDVTHCPEGHPYDEVNTYYAPGSDRRHCRACKRKWDAGPERRALAAANRDYLNAQSRARRAQETEEQQAARAEKQRRWRARLTEDQLEARRATARAHVAANRDAINARARELWADKRDDVNARRRERRAGNRDAANERLRARRVAKRAGLLAQTQRPLLDVEPRQGSGP